MYIMYPSWTTEIENDVIAATTMEDLAEMMLAQYEEDLWLSAMYMLHDEVEYTLEEVMDEIDLNYRSAIDMWAWCWAEVSIYA